MKKIVCYFKISISYGNTGYIWYTITTPSPESLFSVGEMKSLKFTTPAIHSIVPSQYCSGGRARQKCAISLDSPSSKPLRTCKRGVVAMTTNTKHSLSNTLFYIAFGGLPCVDDTNLVYGEIIEGFDVLDAIEAAGSVTGKPKTSVRIIECGRYNERKHGMILSKLKVQNLKSAAGNLKLDSLT